MSRERLSRLLQEITGKRVKAIEPWRVSFSQVQGGRVVPIEVKSGRNIRSHAAIDRLLGIGECRIRDAIFMRGAEQSRDIGVFAVEVG